MHANLYIFALPLILLPKLLRRNVSNRDQELLAVGGCEFVSFDVLIDQGVDFILFQGGELQHPAFYLIV